MARVTNLYRDVNFGKVSGDDAFMEVTGTHEKQGIRTHLLLVTAMALVIAIVTGLSLLLIRHRLRVEVANDLAQDLSREARH